MQANSKPETTSGNSAVQEKGLAMEEKLLLSKAKSCDIRVC